MAKKTEAEVTKPDEETSEQKLKRLEGLECLFEEVSRFTSLIREQGDELLTASAAVAEAKEAYENAKRELSEIESMRNGAKENLFRFLSPKDGKLSILPLFDKMEATNEVIHGENSTQWRQEPIASLKISLPSLLALTDSDIVMVGQLQDRVMKDAAGWWKEITNLNAGTAGAIVDRLNDFIFEKTMKK